MVNHYDNPQGISLDGDTSGIHVWVDPPSIESTSKPGQITYLRANYESIHVPADPQQKEVELQFMISSAATKAIIPPGGVQIFGTVAHMHEAGVRATAKLIRDGIHISNVFESQGYDFALQTPHWDLWRLMPGDTIIMSCFYKPHIDRDIRGGYSTDDEMCDLLFGLAPESESFLFGVGWMVHSDEPFRNSFMGNANSVGAAKAINYTKAIYPPTPGGRDYVPLEEHRLDICELVVRDSMEIDRVHWPDPQIPAQIYMICCFVAVSMISLLFRKVAGQLEKDERKKRNTIVYVVLLVFSLLALPVISWTLAQVFEPRMTFDAVSPSTYPFARGLIIAQSVLYLIELFYRIHIRPELVLHHMSASHMVMFLNWVVIEMLSFFVVFKLGLVLTLMAVTEQLMCFAFVVKILGCGSKTWFPPFCHLATWLFILTKIVLTALAYVIMVEGHTGKESSWQVSSHSFSEWNSDRANFSSTGLLVIMAVSLPALLVAQMYVGCTLLAIASAPLKDERMLSSVDDETSDSDLVGEAEAKTELDG